MQKLKLLYFLTSGPVGVVGSEHEVFAYKGSRLTTKKTTAMGVYYHLRV